MTANERDVWSFEDFIVGETVGEASVVLDRRRAALWSRLFGESKAEDSVPAGLVVAAMMEAYIRAIQPRPPGNIHAGQTLAFTGHRPRSGATLRFAFACRDKALKRERRWVWFGVEAHEGDALAATGTLTSIWAA